MPVFAQYNFALNLNSGYLGVGGSFPRSENITDLNLALVTIGMEHIPSNTGFVFSPYKHYDLAASAGDGEGNYLNFSFFNLKLYWNVITLLDGFVYFGTFASVNYLFAGEKVYWDRYVFSAGGHIGFRLSYEGLNYDLISTEVGYRIIDGASRYFVEVKVDMLAFFLSLLYIWGESYD